MSFKRFVVIIFSFLVVCYIIDRIGGYWLYSHYMLSNEKPACAYKTGEVNDVVILGSSRAEYHYNPVIIDSVSGFSCYNYGSSGMNILYDYAILSMLMKKNNKPKICLLEVFYKDIVKAENNWELGCISSLYPLYGRNSGVDSVLNLVGYWDLLPIKISHTYRYNTRIISYLRDAALGIKEDNCGFEEIDGMIDEPISSLDYDSNYNETKINYLRKFVEKCKENNIVCVFCISPMFFNNKPSHSKLYKPMWDIAKAYDVPVWDYSYSESFINDSLLFRDHHHLNKKGVSTFSGIIADRLKKLKLN